MGSSEVIAIGAVFALAIREFFAYQKSKDLQKRNHNSNGAVLEILRSLAPIMAAEQQTSAKMVTILEDIRDVNKENGTKLDNVNSSLSIAMERQIVASKNIEEIKSNL